MTKLQEPKIIEAVQAAAQRFGVKALAAELDMAPSTLYTKLSPFGDRSIAKLSLEEMVEIMRITDDYSALTVMAGELGFTVSETACTVITEDTVYQALAAAIESLGELASAIKSSMEDNILSQREKAELFARAVDAHEALLPILALGKNTAGKGK